MSAEQRNQRMTKLLIRHRTMLYGYIFACVRNHTDAEDIFQEVSLAVVNSFDRLRDESEFVPWTIEIARRRVLAHIRRAERTTILSPELLPVLAEAAGRVSSTGCLAERSDALLECLESLPPRSREVIAMRYDGSTGSIDRVAQKLGRTLQATYSLLKRIRHTLRECVERRLSTEATG